MGQVLHGDILPPCTCGITRHDENGRFVHSYKCDSQAFYGAHRAQPTIFKVWIDPETRTRVTRVEF